MQENDYDGDGEYDEFDEADTNGDGFVDQDEYSRAMASFGSRTSKAKKNLRVFLGMIIGSVALISAVSTYVITGEGFRDMSDQVRYAISVAGVLIVEGTFGALFYGVRQVFTSLVEKVAGYLGMLFMLFVMCCNITLHFMQAKRIPLNGFQQGWLTYGFPIIIVVVLIIVVAISLADPIERLIRLKLRTTGRTHEAVIDAQTSAIDDPSVSRAQITRSRSEARQLASKIVGGAPAAARYDQGGAARPNPSRRRGQ